MLKRTYLRRNVVNGHIVELRFERAHYIAAGVNPAIAAGMPILEAYQTVNKWNIGQDSQVYVYALPAQ